MSQDKVWEPIRVTKPKTLPEEYPQTTCLLWCLGVLTAYLVVQLLSYVPTVFWIGMVLYIQRNNPAIRETFRRLLREVFDLSLPNV